MDSATNAKSMELEAKPEGEHCPDCGAPAIASSHQCPSCMCDIGAPNVRASRAPYNIASLDTRFESAKAAALGSDCLTEFSSFYTAVAETSGVVVTVSAQFARNFLEDNRLLYSNYERLVGAQVRLPARQSDDAKRASISGKLFGTYSEKIIYGALSLNCEGLSSYGDVFLKLRNVSIAKRVSFLETNSFDFFRDHNLSFDDPIPSGYHSDWPNRGKLALAKLGRNLNKGATKIEWQHQLISSDGNRAADNFIEAHIYNTFNNHAVEEVSIREGIKNKEARTDAKLAIAAFRKLRDSQ